MFQVIQIALVQCVMCKQVLCFQTYLVVSMFPLAIAARSTTTDPGFIISIMCFLIRSGARLPRVRGIVISQKEVGQNENTRSSTELLRRKR